MPNTEKEPAPREADVAGAETVDAAPVVLDASAVLSLLFGEPGSDTVADAIAQGATLSAVNLGEVATVLTKRGLDVATIVERVLQQVAVEVLTPADALDAAALYPIGKELGLSLADRTCLALARRLRSRVVTADQSWTRADFGVEVVLIRVRDDSAG